MEDILKQLKKLRSIQADKRFTERSRFLIVGEHKPRNVWSVILKNVELGATFALAGVLIITIFGGFSTWKFLSPLKLSNLDTTGLTAEAQAVDIQIQLSNLSYDEIAGVARSASTASTEQRKNAVIKAQKNSTQPPQVTSINATSSQEDEVLSIEEALEMLAN